MHDFNGHEVNGIHGLNRKKCYNKALYSVNNRHDFKGMHDFKGNFPYDDFFRKTHARLYIANLEGKTVAGQLCGKSKRLLGLVGNVGETKLGLRWRGCIFVHC